MALVACSEDKMPTSSSEDALAKVSAANQALYEALAARDLNKLDQVYSKSSHVRTIHPLGGPVGGILIGYDNIRKSWETVFAQFDEVSIALENPNFYINGNTAWFTGLTKIQGHPVGAPPEVKVPFEVFVTEIYEKQGDNWLLVQHHGTIQAAM
jgi:ketosteroid isomerase-like protein